MRRALRGWVWGACAILAVAGARAADAAPVLVRTLDNGLQVAVFSDRRLPIVQIQVLVPAGTRHESPLESGAATVAALLLTHGTTSRNAAQYIHDVEAIGGTVVGEAARDYATLSGAFRSVDLERGLELVADAVVNPIFDDSEIDGARQELFRRVVNTRSRLDVVAEEHVWACAMKGHPYALPEGGTLEALAALTRSRVIGFHRAQYRPDHALVAVAGDVDPEGAMAAVAEAFGSWGGRARNLAPGARPPVWRPKGLGIRLVDVPGASEAEIRVAVPVAARGSAESYALAVANDLLGGVSGSRLGGSSGGTIQAYSQLAQQREAGLLILATATRTDSVIAALQRLRRALGRFASEPASQAEVERTRRTLGRAFPLRNETLGAQAAQWLTAASLGLGNDYADRYPERVQAVTAEDVRGVAQRYFDPDHAEVVVVGAAAALRPGLEKLGAVEVVSIQDPAAPVVAAPALRMDEPDSVAIQQGRKRVRDALTAHGGLARLEGIKDSRVDAEITLYQGDRSMAGKQVELRREPGQLRTEVQFVQLNSVTALDGDSAWTHVSAGKTDSIVTEGPEGVAAFQRTFASDLPHLLLMAADPKSRVAYRGQDEVGTTLADVVEVVGSDGVRWVLFFDAQAHRLVAAEDNLGSSLRGPALRRLFGEPRLVQGVLWPHYEERQLDGKRTLTLKVSRVQINSGIPASVFKNPAPTTPTPGHRRR